MEIHNLTERSTLSTPNTVPTVQKFLNPLIVKLETLEVKDKTVEKYYQQIKSNFYCSVKAHYLIARDLFDAKTNLKTPDYQRLVEQLGFTGTTQSKYLKVGADIRLWKLFEVGKLPMKWTNQYLLTTLTDEQFEKVEKIIDPETTAKKIADVAQITKEQKDNVVNTLLSLFEIKIDKEEIKSLSVFEKLVDRVKTALSKIPKIQINLDETAKDKMTAYEDKIKKLELKAIQKAEKEKAEKEKKAKRKVQTEINKSVVENLGLGVTA